MEVIINNETWRAGDKFFCPRLHEGKYIVSGEEFKFLEYQHSMIERGYAFRFTDETYHGIKAMQRCVRLVGILNEALNK